MAHMIRQIIQYSDGTETVIDYRGVIENGVLTEDKPEKPKRKSTPKKKTFVQKIKDKIKRK